MYKAISDLCRIEYGASPNKVRSDDNTGIEIYGTGGKVGFSKEVLFQEPLVVVARKGTLDNPILVDKPCWVIDTAYAAIPNCDVDVRWLFYQLLLFDLKRLNESTGVPSISRDYLKKQKIVSQELDVQRKIADILSTVDDVIEQTEAAIDKYQAIKAGIMQDLFTRGIDTQTGKLRPTIEEAPELYKESELGWIPKEWDVMLITDYSNIVTGSTPSTGINEYWNGHINWITPADMSKIKHQYFTDTDRKITAKGMTSCSANLLPERSIVMSSRAPIGYFAIGLKPFTSNQGCKSFELKHGHVSEFHYYNMLHSVRKFLQLGNGSTFTEVSKSEIEKIKLPVPVYNEEQQAISCILISCDESIRKEENALIKYRLIKQGLMADLLTGKVRVNLNDNKVENG